MTKMGIVDKVKKIKNKGQELEHKVTKEISEDSGDMPEHHEISHEGRVVAEYTKKDGKVVASSASPAAQSAGVHEKVSKKLGDKDPQFTSATMMAAKAAVGAKDQNPSGGKESLKKADEESPGLKALRERMRQPHRKKPGSTDDKIKAALQRQGRGFTDEFDSSYDSNEDVSYQSVREKSDAQRTSKMKPKHLHTFDFDDGSQINVVASTHKDHEGLIGSHYRSEVPIDSNHENWPSDLHDAIENAASQGFDRVIVHQPDQNKEAASNTEKLVSAIHNQMNRTRPSYDPATDGKDAADKVRALLANHKMKKASKDDEQMFRDVAEIISKKQKMQPKIETKTEPKVEQKIEAKKENVLDYKQINKPKASEPKHTLDYSKHGPAPEKKPLWSRNASVKREQKLKDIEAKHPDVIIDDKKPSIPKPKLGKSDVTFDQSQMAEKIKKIKEKYKEKQPEEDFDKKVDRVKWKYGLPPGPAQKLKKMCGYLKKNYKNSPENKIKKWAQEYANKKGLTIKDVSPKTEIDHDFALKVADAFHSLKHDPKDPNVQRAYHALQKETLDQFRHLMSKGLKISRIEPDMPNPYKSSKEMINDVHNNNHLWYYPTEQGFGSSDKDFSDHPLMTKTGEKHGSHELLANDVFRIVHDVFGHAKDGTSFGPKGEESAYRAHRQMFSPLAQQALATETRGQNSWVNFSRQVGEHNRKNPDKTQYADQKAAILPKWAQEEY